MFWTPVCVVQLMARPYWISKDQYQKVQTQPSGLKSNSSLLSRQAISESRTRRGHILNNLCTYVPLGESHGAMYDRWNFSKMRVNDSIPVSFLLPPLQLVVRAQLMCNRAIPGPSLVATTRLLIRHSTWSWTLQSVAPMATSCKYVLPIPKLIHRDQSADIYLKSDGYKGKPWVGSSTSSMEDFWSVRSAWESTWGDGDARGMSVKSVKMYQRGKCAVKAW